MAAGAVEAVRDAGRQNSPTVIGLGGGEAGLGADQDGSMHGIILQSPVLDGRHAVETALGITAGEYIVAETFPELEKIAAGGVAECEPKW